jgi:UDP-N-acetylmuramyl tripeptide synthase
VTDRRAAIARALATARDGDVVVIAGSRGEPQQAYGMLGSTDDRGDAATARQLLFSSVRAPRLRVVA